MSWNRKKRISGKNKYYSIRSKLKRENKISSDFEIMLNNLTLEDIIALKLEYSINVAGTPVYGLQLSKALRYICKEALYKLALSATRSKNSAARFLGVSENDFRQELKRMKIESFFLEK
jgi:hypothetical protein|tara:strand:+ start:1870 stop:2226 length:357 start_codon:yes stop_codon:yes gene_type:complete